MKPARFRVFRCCCACVLAVVLVAPLQGKPAEQPPQTQPDDVQQLVAELSSGEFTRRRTAFLQLWERGEAVLPAVLGAKSSADVQVGQSVAILEALIKLKIKPDEKLDSQKVSLLLLDPSPARMTQLCRLGFWELAESIIAQSPELREEFLEQSGPSEVGRIVALASNAGNPELAWPIMQRVLDPKIVGFAAGVQGWATDTLDLVDATERATIDFFSGEVDAALEIKGVSARDRISWIARAGRWEQLAEPGILDDYTNAVRSTELQMAVRAAVLDLAGKHAASMQLWDELDRQLIGLEGELTEQTRVQAGVELIKRSGTDEPFAIYVLMIAGRIEAIEQHMVAIDPENAYLFLVNNSKYTEAFEALGLKADFSNFDEWLAKQEEIATGEIVSPINCDRMARVANLLVKLGYAEKAENTIETCLRAAGVAAQSIRGSRRSNYWTAVWGTFAARMSSTESRDLILRLFKSHFDEVPVLSREPVMRRLYPAFPGAVAMLLETVPGQPGSNMADPNLAPEEEAWEALELLSRSDTGDALPLEEIPGWLRRATAGLVRQRDASAVMDELMQIAIGYGMKDLALSLSLDPTVDIGIHHARSARIMIGRGSPEVAINLLARLRQYGVQQFLPLEIEARLLAGDFSEAQNLEQSRMLIPLVSSSGASNKYEDIATQISGEHDYERAEPYARAGFLLSEPYSLGSFFSSNTYAICLEELERFRESSDARRAIAVELLHPSSAAREALLPGFGGREYDYIGYFNYGIQKDRMHRALSDLRQGEVAAAWHEIRAGQRAQPHDIEMVVQCYADLKQLDAEKADAMFSSFEKTLLEHLQRWPKDGTSLNNLAWMYAKTGRSLEEAAKLSERAVALSPESDIFIDTLAEVHYQRGDVDSAIELMQKCVRLNPTESHYRENLIRFRGRQP